MAKAAAAAAAAAATAVGDGGEDGGGGGDGVARREAWEIDAPASYLPATPPSKLLRSATSDPDRL